MGILHSPKLQNYWNLTIRLFRVITGHSLGESYTSAEMQSVYSAAPADWAKESNVKKKKRKKRRKKMTVPIISFIIVHHVYIYRTPPSRSGCDTRSIFKWIFKVFGLNFSSLKTGCLSKAKEPNLPYYLPRADGRRDGFMPFPRVLARSETQTPTRI